MCPGPALPVPRGERSPGGGGPGGGGGVCWEEIDPELPSAPPLCSHLRAPGHMPAFSGPPSPQPVCAGETPGVKGGTSPSCGIPSRVSHCTVKMSATMPNTAPRILFLPFTFLRFICLVLPAVGGTGRHSAHRGRHTNRHRCNRHTHRCNT